MSQDTYYLSSEEISEMPNKLRTHFLNENAQRRERALGKAAGMEEVDFAIVEIYPGDESTEHHKHYHEEECLYVLEGKGVAMIGRDSFAVKAGDFIGYRKGGLAHSLRNTGDTTLRCISVRQRKNHDVSDYPRLGKRLFRNKDLTWNMVDLTVIDRPFGAKT
ncbi:MAG: cupin domain-containing protein [Pseudomonadota bacterium]